MTSFEEAYTAAASWLGERELLLNSQLLQMASGDEALRNEVRACLLSDGVALDRYGIGLVRGERSIAEQLAGRSRRDHFEQNHDDSSAVTFAEVTDLTRTSTSSSDSDADINAEQPAEADWWLMAGGATRGPFSFETLRRMRQRGEIADTNLVRQGERGQWCGPHNVEGLVETAEGVETALPLARKGDSLREAGPTSLAANEREKTANGEATNRPVAAPIVVSARPEATGDSITRGSAPDSEGEWEFFLWEGGRPVGPVSRSDLHERLEKHLLLEDEFVQVGVDGEWQPVSKALNMRRSPLKTLANSKRLDTPPDSTPQDRSDQRRSDASVSTARSARDTTRKPVQSAANTDSSFNTTTTAGRAWQHAAAFVGGTNRLQGLVAALVALIALVIWLRQPPTASTIYREFAQYNIKLAELRAKRTGPTDWKQATMRDQQRVQSLLDSLKKRASAARPIEQQLLWAGQYGLVQLFKRPVDATEFERHFATHMSLAKKMLAAGTATPPSTNMPSAPSSVNSPGSSIGTSVEMKPPQVGEQK